MANIGWVDLTTRATRITRTPEDHLRRFLGGRGLAARLLYELVPPGIGPDDPMNAVILASGPLNGTP